MEQSAFGRSLRNPWQWVGVGFIVLFLSAIAIGPLMSPNRLGHHQWRPLEDLHAVGLAMYSYANDNDGNYPTGRSSTEIFQKLIDGGYITDLSVLCPPELNVPGKTKAASKQLKPENVCWDVTMGADSRLEAEFALPLVFSTGYRIEYMHGTAFPRTPAHSDGLAVFYVSNSTSYVSAKSDSLGIVAITPENFQPTGKKYTQLTPDGPLP